MVFKDPHALDNNLYHRFGTVFGILRRFGENTRTDNNGRYWQTNCKGRVSFVSGLGVEPCSPMPAMDQHGFAAGIVSRLFIRQRHANRVRDAEKGAFVFCQLGCLDSRPHGCHLCVFCLDRLYCINRKCNYYSLLVSSGSTCQ